MKAPALLGVLGGCLLLPAPAHGQDIATLKQEAARAHRVARTHAQLHVQPAVLTVTSTVSAITVQLTNPLDTSLTVDYALRFAYPQVDTAGVLVLDSLGGGAVAAAHDLRAWVHGLPAQLHFAPHETHTVVLTVTVPPHLPDGEYWATLVAVERGVVQSVDLAGGSATFGPEDIATAIPLVYQQGAGASTSALRLTQVQATALGDSVMRICMTLQPTGLAHATGTIQVALQTGNPAGDTVLTQRVTVYVPTTPCVAVPVRAVPTGVSTIQVTVTGPAPADSTRPAPVLAHRVLVVRMTRAMRAAAQAARARRVAHRDSLYTNVTLTPAGGALASQLAAAAQDARRRGRVPVIDLGASWCGPCHLQDSAMALPALDTTMRGMYLIHLDVDQWGPALAQFGVPTTNLPLLLALDHAGHPGPPLLQGTFFTLHPGESVAAAMQREGVGGLAEIWTTARAQWAASQ